MRLPFLSGSAKSRLRSDINELRRISVELGADRLDRRLGALWTASCDGAADTVEQLFVENSDKTLDWGLKRHRKRLNGQRLAAIYWWMLLYQLVMFRNRGIDGYDRNEDFDAMRETAEDLMAELVRLPHIGAVNPGPLAGALAASGFAGSRAGHVQQRHGRPGNPHQYGGARDGRLSLHFGHRAQVQHRYKAGGHGSEHREVGQGAGHPRSAQS